MATYYVSPSGSDGANGSSGTPWKTLTKASNMAAAGDTVRVRPGTYKEAWQFKEPNVTFIADDPNNRPVIDGNYHPGLMSTAELATNTTLPRADGAGFLGLTGKSPLVRVSVQGSTLDGFIVQASAGTGIVIGASNVTVRNCVTFWTFDTGIQCNPSSPIGGLLVENCEFLFASVKIFEPQRRTYTACSPNSQCVSGVAKFGNITGLIFRNNRVAFGFGEGLNIGKANQATAESPIIVEGNVAHDNNHSNIYINASRHVVIRRNIVYCGGAFVNTWGNGPPAGIRIKDELYTYADHIWIYNNLIVNLGPGIAIGERHTKMSTFYCGYNTVVGGSDSANSGSPAIFVKRGSSVGGGDQRGVVENNLIDWTGTPTSISVLNNATGEAGTAFRNNAWSSLPVAGMRSSGDVVGQLKLVNPRAVLRTDNYLKKTHDTFAKFITTNTFDADNYRPAAGSPAIGAAADRMRFNNVTPPSFSTDLNGDTRTDLNRPGGKFWDVGAIEYGGIVAPPEDEIAANFSQSATQGQAPLTVAFTDTSTEEGDAEIDTWSWDFGDGYTSTAQNPSHTYATPGTYSPTLVVTDSSSGLSDTRVGDPIVVRSAPPPGDGQDVVLRQSRTALRTSNGSQTFSQAGLGGLTPKSARLIVTGATSDGAPADGAMFGYGFAAGGAQVAVAVAAKHGEADTTAARFWTDRACLVLIDGGGNEIVRATFVDWTANGVTVNVQWTGTPAAYLVTVVFGAGESYRAWAGSARLDGTGASRQIDCGFEPDVIHCAATWGDWESAAPDATISLGIGHRLGAAYVLERNYATALTDGSNRARLFEGFVAHSRYTVPNGRSSVQVSGWGATGLTLTVANDPLNSTALVLVEKFGTVSSAIALATTSLMTPYPLDWDPQYVQHILSPQEGMGASNDTHRAGTIGLHTVTADGEFSNQISSENGSATTNEQSLSDDQFIVVNHTGGTLASGSTALGTGQYSIAFGATPGVPLLLPMLAVEEGEAVGGGGDYVTAQFEGDVVFGPVPLRVAFQDLSAGTNPITSWAWDFGDGDSSTEQNPAHVYRSGGEFAVTLTVSDGTLSDTEAKEGYIAAIEATKRRIRIGPFIVRPVTESTVSQTHWDADSDDCGYMDVGLRLNVLRLNADPLPPAALPDEIAIYNDAAGGDLKVRRPDGSEGTIDVT